MLLLSHGLLLSFADLLNSSGYDIRVLSGEGLARAPADPDSARLAADIERLPEVEPSSGSASSRPRSGPRPSRRAAFRSSAARTRDSVGGS